MVLEVVRDVIVEVLGVVLVSVGVVVPAVVVNPAGVVGAAVFTSDDP